MNEQVDDDLIYPSYWADYLSKVAEVTLLPVFPFIWHRLSYARGLQFIMVWNRRNGYECIPAASVVKRQLDQLL